MMKSSFHFVDLLRPALVLIICLFVIVPQRAASQPQIDFQNIEVFATVQNGELRLTVRNNSNQNYLILDDFCFDINMHSTILVVPTLETWTGGYFSNGLARKQGRMMLLKARGERTCVIGYSGTSSMTGFPRDRTVVVWNTNLFVGDFYDNYAVKHFSGTIPTSFPFTDSGSQAPATIDAAALEKYRNRKVLGVIE